ncbi:uncharacterized protein LOC107636394 [Arachis ipaensis]|uniref:uncharacterized protein LOC107636394 n=1 Tax=Arachis ipaensis TaxID=130454 RepID=UPI0007AF756B|nr:uncharacterized protein LOC107636394 [Arachis ipaensis]
MDTHPTPLSTPEYRTRMPYPQKFCQAEKDKKFARFADYLKTVEIKIPFAKALEKIPSYAKTLPEKLQDLGSFVIPCTLGDGYTRKSLCDLGARINLMPLSLLRNLGTQEVKPIRICLQLADGSIKFPSGVVEDMINTRIFPSFFLATRRTFIDVQKGEVTLRVNEDQYVLNAVKAMQYPDTPEECMRIDIIDPLVEEVHAIERLEEELDDILGDDT